MGVLCVKFVIDWSKYSYVLLYVRTYVDTDPSLVILCTPYIPANFFNTIK
jgi:hypothetical protein